MASSAVEEGIRSLNCNIDTLNINYFRYTNPVIADVIMRTYHGMLRKRPELWDYLYDNNNVKEKTTRFRNILYKINSAKLRKLVDWYNPDVIVCTQAFPCVAMAEYKRTQNIDIPIVGVVTDYGVHSYWADKDVDLYIVPNQEGKDKFTALGIDKTKIEIISIPILSKFYLPLDNKKLRYKFGLDNGESVVLIMGGSQGMVSMDKIVRQLIRLPLNLHLIIVCGENRVLYKKMEAIGRKYKVNMHLYQYIDNIDELMTISDLIITKPGGLTITESITKGLPIIIINPIPGQETKNTEYLVSKNVAVKAGDERDVARHVGDLLTNPALLKDMKTAITNLSKPKTAVEIAEKIIERCCSGKIAV